MKSTFKKTLSVKKPPKSDREQAVLLGLIELYLKTGKPIGSQTLQENGFDSLSSATIRNYLSKMEEAGFVKQQHISGGRIPTEKAFRLYADAHLNKGIVERAQEELFEQCWSHDSKEMNTTIHRSADLLSDLAKCAVFISSPRFDQDFVQDVRLVQLDRSRILSVIITDFGQIRTETIYLEKEVGAIFLRTVEEYFLWRMNRGEKPFFKEETESKMAQRIYNEVMVRHVIGHSPFPEENVIRTGLSKLLVYPEFNDAAALANSLALLENSNQVRAILQESCKKNGLCVWVGNELYPFVPKDTECAVIAMPYRINHIVAGAIALLGPMRLPYRNLFGLIQIFSEQMGKALTDAVYKHKLTFRPSKDVWADKQQIEVKQ